ncbi:MAG: HD domain-containing protein [Candidatus Omnitrophota bacterium]|nr:HD domain-containing protein [Candidatus Omnitrophota bacterium]
MDLQLESLQNNPNLKTILKLAQKNKQKVYLVGGFLRDLILNRNKEKNFDLDFAVSKQAMKLAKSFARNIHGAFVVLDKERGYARVVKNLENKSFTFDFANLRGKNIKQDLQLRDFTINTLALNLECLKTAQNLSKVLLSPFKGLEDLKKSRIRMVNRQSFLDDPLRLLRAFSLSAQLDFVIEPKTLKRIRQLAKKIQDVAYERIRDEFFKILKISHSIDFIRQMDKVKILDKVIPQIRAMYGVKQGPYHHLDVFRHSLEALAQLERLVAELSNHQKIQDYLREVIAANRTRLSLVKLGALLHDIGKPKAKKRLEGKTVFYGHERLGRKISDNIADMLKLSTREKFALEKLIFWHLRPGYLAEKSFPTSRAIFRFFRDAEEEAPAILLIGIADQRATRGPLTAHSNRIHHEKVVMDLIDYYFKKQEEKPFVRLIDGNDLIKKLKLTPGPIFAKILREIEEAQAEGSIKTKQEALELAGKIAKRQ